MIISGFVWGILHLYQHFNMQFLMNIFCGVNLYALICYPTVITPTVITPTVITFCFPSIKWLVCSSHIYCHLLITVILCPSFWGFVLNIVFSYCILFFSYYQLLLFSCFPLFSLQLFSPVYTILTTIILSCLEFSQQVKDW